MQIHIYHHHINEPNEIEKHILNEIKEIKDLIANGTVDPNQLLKMAQQLDKSTNELKDAVAKNTPPQ